ncbi:MAG: prepilin-type N-terminal cleavage/methylation domain-containing protein [Acidobacteriota bacterium]
MELDACRCSRAFTLLEVLIALAILAIALSSSVALMAQYQVLDGRVSGQLEAQRVLEAQVESLRGGWVVPLEDGRYPLEPVRAAAAPVEGLGLVVDVERQPWDGLYRLEVISTYRILGKAYERRVELFLWRP